MKLLTLEEVRARIKQCRAQLDDLYAAERVLLQEASTPAQRAGNAGGHARARALTPERRREIAIKAASVRWGNGAYERSAVEPPSVHKL